MSSSLNCLKYVSDGSWNYTLLFTLSTLHCMSFSCSGLPISKYCTIITLQYWLNDRQCSVIKDRLLFACWRKNRIESKISHNRKVWFLRIRIFDTNSTLIFEDLNNEFIIGLFFIRGSATHDDFDSLSFRRSLNFWRHCLNIGMKEMRIISNINFKYK